jgi:thiopurine S-methyltransferase
MDANFWRQKWEQNEIAFHEPEANPALVQHWGAMGLQPGSRVFVPLCGKTLDIHWLLAQGYRVAGAELTELAVQQLFAELGVPEPRITDRGKVRHYSAEGIDIFVGDIFDLTREELGAVDAVYDRAALVALPEEMRARYAAHLMELTERAPQLLICYVYDQSAMAGPPFAISDAEVARHYAGTYEVTRLASAEVPGGLKGRCAAVENVWWLHHAR